jgi:hypothetical protein
MPRAAAAGEPDRSAMAKLSDEQKGALGLLFFALQFATAAVQYRARMGLSAE